MSDTRGRFNARKSLDQFFLRFRPVADLCPPPHGWIRAIRDALGMTTTQLAARMKIKQPSVTALEQAEAEETITLARLRRAAEALNCTLVYALVPNSPLEEIVRDKARVYAAGILNRIDKTMRLEAQGLDENELCEEHDALTAEIIRNNIRRIWDVM